MVWFSIRATSLNSSLAHWKSGDLDATRDRVLLAHQDRLDRTGAAAHRLDRPACWEGKLAIPRLAHERIQIQPLENHRPLHGFLPGLEQPVADLQFLDQMESWFFAVSHFGDGRFELPDHPGLKMKEAYLDSNNRILRFRGASTRSAWTRRRRLPLHNSREGTNHQTSTVGGF